MEYEVIAEYVSVKLNRRVQAGETVELTADEAKTMRCKNLISEVVNDGAKTETENTSEQRTSKPRGRKKTVAD